MIRTSALSSMLSVNAQAVCDCGAITFQIGIAAPADRDPTGANFIRILQCTDCGKQLPTIHHQPDGLAPALRKAAVWLAANPEGEKL